MSLCNSIGVYWGLFLVITLYADVGMYWDRCLVSRCLMKPVFKMTSIFLGRFVWDNLSTEARLMMQVSCEAVYIETDI
jgi:hypothetical protein